MEESDVDIEELKIKAVIGFDGGIENGLLVHPDGQHIVYALGNKVTIQNWNTKKQYFLVGHTNVISAIAVSKSGKYVASGQINHIGFKARVIIWDYDKKELISHHEHHKVRVEAVTFSKDDAYVITLGGRDCGFVVVWDIKSGQVICGTQVAKGIQGEANVLQAMIRRGSCFITGGECHLTVWTIHRTTRNTSSVDVAMAKLKRNILCLDTNERDEFCYCGTTTGDVLKVRLYFHHDPEIIEPVKQPAVIGCWAKISRKRLPRGCVDLYQLGIHSILLLFNGQLIIGAGDGTVELVEEFIGKNKLADISVKFPSVPALKILKTTNVNGEVTSLRLIDEKTLLAATVNSEIYLIKMDDFKAALVVTCHTSAIYDLAFPHNFSEVFATAGKQDVRVWSMSTMQELLRIRVQNFSCSSVVFAFDGKSILTGWSDGIIRSFTPLTGRLIYAILNAHNKGVSALTTTSHGKTLVSGGCEGQVRLWDVSPYKQTLLCTLKEHKGPIAAIHINMFDTEAVSASSDGSCIIWDLERQCRKQILFANTLFMSVRYFPSGVQILTAGSDRKLAYWEVLDGSVVRELEGSPTGTINSIDISPDGGLFVSGGNDQIVKVWRYQEGIATHIGLGHAAVVTATCFSADGKSIVTCDAAGCVFVWACPQDYKRIEKSKPTEQKSTEKVTSPKNISQVAHRKSKEEHIKDLPSVRSSRSGGDITHRSVESHACECECKCNLMDAAGEGCQVSTEHSIGRRELSGTPKSCHSNQVSVRSTKSKKSSE